MFKCDRCGKEANPMRMSYFNTDMCCMECLQREAMHPLYEKAKEVELEEVKKGNYSFKGIGKPEDL